MTFRISGCIYNEDEISVSILTFLEVKDLEKNKTNYLTLTVDLDRQGQIHFYMTFLIFGCIQDTDSILVSILTNSRSAISGEQKLVTWLRRLTSRIKVKLTIQWPSSFYVVYMI